MHRSWALQCKCFTCIILVLKFQNRRCGGNNERNGLMESDIIHFSVQEISLIFCDNSYILHIINIVTISNSRLCSERYPPREVIFSFFFFFNKNRVENYSGTAKQIYKRLSAFYKFALVFIRAVLQYSHISERNGVFGETNTAIMAWKIADIITLSYCISTEVFSAKLQGSFNTVCYLKGVMYWCCTHDN